MFRLLLNPDNGALCLISVANPDIFDYLIKYPTLIADGTRNHCREAAEEYFNDNFIPDEQQIYITVR